MTTSLPANANLERLRNEAKSVLKAHKKGEPSCCAIIRNLYEYNGKSDTEILSAKVPLAKVQFALAIEYGYKSWAELKRSVRDLSSRDVHRKMWQCIVDRLDKGSDMASALSKVSSCVPGTKVARAAAEVAESVASGQDLGEAMKSFHAEFTPLICLLCQAPARRQKVAVERILAAVNHGVLGPGAPVSGDEQTAFWKVFSLCLSTGIPIIPSLETIAGSYIRDAKLKKALNEIRAALTEGEALSAAMRSHPEVFAAKVCDVISASERSGRLGECTAAVAKALESDDPTRLDALLEEYQIPSQATHSLEDVDAAPIIRIANMILVEALRRGSTGVVLDPEEEKVRLYFEKGADRTEANAPPLVLYFLLTARFKVMSDLDLEKTDASQEGRFTMRAFYKECEITVRTIPQEFGERIELVVKEIGESTTGPGDVEIAG
ncbi:ATPase, T2SS/T4P/T4SS family [Verrucomicrobiota bacterium]